jgi:hypothetical protein
MYARLAADSRVKRRPENPSRKERVEPSRNRNRIKASASRQRIGEKLL